MCVVNGRRSGVGVFAALARRVGVDVVVFHSGDLCEGRDFLSCASEIRSKTMRASEVGFHSASWALSRAAERGQRNVGSVLRGGAL